MGCGINGKKQKTKNPYRKNAGGLDRHHKKEWAKEIRDPIDKLCLPESVKNKMKRDQFNDVEILILLCDDCHLKAHGWKKRK